MGPEMHFGETTEDDGWIDHDPPFADPAIRLEYESALGAFILAFNESDYFTGRLLSAELARSQRGHLYDPEHDFSARLALLEGIAPMADNLRGLPFALLRSIATVRNKLAHGHFNQNPFGGDYKLIVREKHRQFSTADVRAFTGQLCEINAHLRVAYVVYDFL